MASVIVIDTDLKDSVKEYSQIIDTTQQSSVFSQSISGYFTDALTNQEVIAKIYEVSRPENLSKLTEKEFEPAFNLLIHLSIEILGVQVLENPKSEIFSILIASNPKTQPTLRDRKSIKSTTIVSIFNTIFNLISEGSSNRVYIILQILNIIRNSTLEFALVEDNIGNNLIQWLVKAGSDESEIRNVFWEFIQLDSKFTIKSLQFIKRFTETYELNLKELTNLIIFALNSEVVDVSFLVTNNVSKALTAHADDKLVATFKKYVSGDLVKITSEFNLPVELVNSKSRILSLANFFGQSTKITFNYSEIPNVESAEDFETLLVTAIKAGIIEGKLNQIDQTFTLTSVRRFILAGNTGSNDQNWGNVKKALIDWKNSLHNIGQIVESSRENIVNAGSN